VGGTLFGYAWEHLLKKMFSDEMFISCSFVHNGQKFLAQI
jgi:hypothetical protein